MMAYAIDDQHNQNSKIKIEITACINPSHFRMIAYAIDDQHNQKSAIKSSFLVAPDRLYISRAGKVFPVDLHIAGKATQAADILALFIYYR